MKQIFDLQHLSSVPVADRNGTVDDCSGRSAIAAPSVEAHGDLLLFAWCIRTAALLQYRNSSALSYPADAHTTFPLVRFAASVRFPLSAVELFLAEQVEKTEKITRQTVSVRAGWIVAAAHRFFLSA